MFNYSSDNLTSKEIRIEIGKRLHNERIRAKISLDELAELTGYSKPTVQRWERGWKAGTGENIIPTLDQIIELCAIYKCSPGYLLCEYHDRTRQAFDAALELGLTEESVQRLQALHAKQISTVQHIKKPIIHSDVFICFLNYLICHSDYLYNLLLDRKEIYNHDKHVRFHVPYVDIAEAAFDDPEIQRLILQYKAFKNTKPSIQITDQLTNALIKFYENHPRYYKGSIYSPESLTNAALLYLDVVFPASSKQSDFLISETFLDLLKAFYNNSDDVFYDYENFLRNQFKKKIDEHSD